MADLENHIEAFDDKLKRCFSTMVVFKDLKKNNFFSALGLPSFLRDWLLRKFQNADGQVDTSALTEYVHEKLPDRNEWVGIKNRIIYEREKVKILTRVSVDISVKNEEITFSLPDFGLQNKDTIIEPMVWDDVKDQLTDGQDIWGVVELGYRVPDETAKPKIAGKIKLTGFKSFRPYKVNSEFFKDARAEFSTSEWLDVLLGAVDYNPHGYKDEPEKLAMLTRLLPFVEKRLNLIELAPKGTGKSYVFGHVSKYGLLTDGGKVTRSKMFYDMSSKHPGFIFGHDYVAIDEVKLVQFGDTNEMRSIMQGYMEYGEFNIGGFTGKSDAGVVFLGNIDEENMDEYQNMFTELPSLFQESALLDRIHGFVKGWEIPRMHDDLKVCGWSLNSEYFCSILHELRSDASYRVIVDEIVDVPPHSDTRDTEAIKRLTTAYMKLLFPNWRSAKDVNEIKFLEYCLQPAMKMRKIIKIQLGILDTEFRGKSIPDLSIKELAANED